MAEGKTSKQAQFERALAGLEMAVKSGRITDPLIQDYVQRGFSPLKDGAHAAKAQAILANLLTGPAILAGLGGPAEPPEPKCDRKGMLLVGWRRALDCMTGILWSLVSSHLLIQGPTGSGKTTLIWKLIEQCVEAGVGIIFHDHKNEGRKLLWRYSDTVVLRPCDFRENVFKPVGDPKRYFTMFFSEFARSYRLRRETVVKLIAIAIRVAAGLKPDEPHPSLQDFACLLRKIGQREGDPTMDTAATALESLNATLGECATVREGPCAEDMFRIVVVQCQGLPAEFLQFFMGIRLYRTHLKAIARGHSGALSSVIISDEGGIEFAKELGSESGSGYITPQKRLITQFRSTGTGLIIAAQSVSAIDPAVIANVGSFMCLKAQSAADAGISARLLGLSEERLLEVRGIPRWSGLFKSPSHVEAVRVELPEVNMGAYMSDAELDERNRPALDQLNARTVFAPPRNDAGTPIAYREVLGETTPEGDATEAPIEDLDIRAEHSSFVAEIVAHPDASIVEHYANLGWSAGRGTRVKVELITFGFLEAQRQRSANGRPIERLVLTEKGRARFDA